MSTTLANPYSGSGISKLDADRAVNIAESWWKNVKDEKKAIIPQYLHNVFELWKIDHGVIRIKGTGLAGALGFNRERPTDDEGFELLERSKPWECLPLSLHEKTPIDLLLHIWTTDYPEFDQDLFFDCLAWLIMDCGDQNNPQWWPKMVSASLPLSNLQIKIGDSLSEKFKKQWPKIKRDDQRQAGTKKERRPEITEWLTKQLKNNPDIKSPELWQDAPTFITDQISIDRFKKRVSGVRKKLKCAASN